MLNHATRSPTTSPSTKRPTPIYADDRNFYKVEKWTRDGTKVDSLLYAGNSLGRARSIFEAAISGGRVDQTDHSAAGASAR
jgi:hypothetical protein